MLIDSISYLAGADPLRASHGQDAEDENKTMDKKESKCVLVYTFASKQPLNGSFKQD